MKRAILDFLVEFTTSAAIALIITAPAYLVVNCAGF